MCARCREKSLKLQYENAASSPSELAKLLNLSPSSKEQVTTLMRKGVMRTCKTASPVGDKRNRFLERVGRCYAPIIDKICCIPKFQGRSRPVCVLEAVLQRLKQKARSKRKLQFVTAQPSKTTPSKTSKPTAVKATPSKTTMPTAVHTPKPTPSKTTIFN